MEKTPNSLEKRPESFEEYEDLIKYYEDIEVEERLKPKVEYGPHKEEFEKLLAPLLKEENIRELRAIETKEEALNSEERDFANKALVSIIDKMKFLDRRTNITAEELDELRKKYKIVANAVGFINNGVVDHHR